MKESLEKNVKETNRGKGEDRERQLEKRYRQRQKTDFVKERKGENEKQPENQKREKVLQDKRA